MTGDKGEDVRALQVELVRLGYHVTADGTAGPVTLSSVADLFKTAGDTSASSNSVPADRIVWIPASSTVVATCAAPLGNLISAGDTLATLSGGLTSVSIQQVPADLVPGDRVLRIESLEVPVNAEGVVADPAALAQIAASPSLEHQTTKSSGPAEPDADTNDLAKQAITGRFTLATPISVGVVPPTAVYSIEQDHGCVSSAGKPQQVVIVGSQLGQTYILPSDEASLKRVDLAPNSRNSCR
ncbi:peptidoglycan-binding domain-containing protein [Plantibacter sp. YIM 135249]|uniref:peptidoglycan-binding domain-containing protein n=1 Tax=Plantibacter sp. YIM 135249 TaxID=3423918 RepID=UPI003D33BF80